MDETGRGIRIALTALAVALGVWSSSAAAHSINPEFGAARVYVIVIDGLHPDEIDETTPNLHALRNEGTWFANARSIVVPETIPNHVAMMTGVLPAESGIVANTFLPDPADPGRCAGPECGVRDMDSPDLLEVDTIITRLERECANVVPGGRISLIHTASVLSKTYLHGIFSAETGCEPGPGCQEQADFHWTPFPVIPESNHSPDAFTLENFETWAASANTPQFAFVNLGDVDRSGHIDVSGNTGVPAFQRTARQHVDTQLGAFVQFLKAAGYWKSTFLLIVSDHSMDWSLPDRAIDVATPLAAAGLTEGSRRGENDFQLAPNGGATMIYVSDPANVPVVAEVVAVLDGVARVVRRNAPDPADDLASLGIDSGNAGDVVAFAEDAWRFAADGFTGQIPGNHGHGVTQPQVLLVTGGHDALKKGATVSGLPRSTADVPEIPAGDGVYGNLNVAPTVAALFGLPEPVTGPFAAPALTEAFVEGIPTICLPPGD